LKYFFGLIVFSAAIGFIFPPWNNFLDFAWLTFWLVVVPAAASFVWWYEKKEQRKN